MIRVFLFIIIFLIQIVVIASPSRPMTYEDIVLLEKPKQVVVSSKGRIAFVVQSADIENNQNVEKVNVCEEGSTHYKTIWTSEKIDQLIWINDVLYVLGKQDNEYCILSFEQEPKKLLSTTNPISNFVVDRTNHLLYYTQTRYTSEQIVQQRIEEGYVYRWGKDHARNIMIDKKYKMPEFEEIWLMDIATGKRSLAVEMTYKDWHVEGSLISDLKLSENGNELVMLVSKTGRPELGEHVWASDIWVWNRLSNSLKMQKEHAKKTEDIHIPLQQADKNDSWIAYVSEEPNQPPQVVVQNKQTNTTSYLTELNTHLENVSRGLVTPFMVNNGDCSANGYLVHPVNEQIGTRYPLIIATYGFSGKKFIADGEWHSSFPAQVLANEGYYVLLLNHCGLAQNLVGDSEKAREIEGWNVLKTFEKAVDLLDHQGVIDPEKVGIYGWSHGAFMVEFLLSHSEKFKVGCLGEGSDYGPTNFFLTGTKYMTTICDNIYSGPPWGESLKNYIEFSSLFNVHHIKAPLLMEFVGGAVNALELYVPLRYLGIPAELVLYEGEKHNFVKPKARIASMKRKVDWFNFWLLDKINPQMPEQNERWQTMRQECIQMT